MALQLPPEISYKRYIDSRFLLLLLTKYYQDHNTEYLLPLFSVFILCFLASNIANIGIDDQSRYIKNGAIRTIIEI